MRSRWATCASVLVLGRQKNRKVQFGGRSAPVCATLSKQPWVMQNIKSWRTYEDMNEPEGEDYLQVIRDISRNVFTTNRIYT